MCPSRSAEGLRGHINVPIAYKELMLLTLVIIYQKCHRISFRKKSHVNYGLLHLPPPLYNHVSRGMPFGIPSDLVLFHF